ncbi:hypothetical protein BH18ACI3_BH18ACI3_15810 [soil metagenome]
MRKIILNLDQIGAFHVVPGNLLIRLLAKFSIFLRFFVGKPLKPKAQTNSTIDPSCPKSVFVILIIE